ncbi:MAG TPA: hypothetical protein VMV95_00195 [Bacillota bacterium]|nr:hypothetical protein [Bacillota bacterium]
MDKKKNETKKEQKEKLGFWLILFKVLVIISIIRNFMDLVDTGSLLIGISFGFSIVVLLLMIHRQKAFIPFAIVAIWYPFIIDFFYLPLLFEELTNGMVGGLLVGKIIFSLAWTIYLLSSPKVKRIFKERIFE